VKKRNFLRILSGVLLLAITVTIPSMINVSAEDTTGTTYDGFEYKIENSEVTITGYSGIAAELIIPDTIQGHTVRRIGEDAFKNCDKITSVIVSDSIYDIGDCAFAWCDRLTDIRISDSVTFIGEHLFNGCGNLSQIKVDENNTMYDSRENCNAIIETSTNTLLCGCKNTIIPDTVTTISYGSFWGCESLNDINIPNSVTFIDKQAFLECNSLVSITIPASVTEMGVYVFSNCDSLEAIYVDDENTAYCDFEGVLFDKAMTTLIRYPRAKKASSYHIPHGVLYLDNGCFTDCENLTEVILPESLEQLIYNTFTGCDNIKEFTVPKSVWRIGASAFNCKGMTDITIMNPDCVIDDSTLTIANTFRGEYSYTGTIHGYEGSTAQAYAEKYGYSFMAISEPSTEPAEIVYGDADNDGEVKMNDVIRVMLYSSNSNAYPLDEKALNACDVYQRGDGVTLSDALSIQKMVTQIIRELPES